MCEHTLSSTAYYQAPKASNNSNGLPIGLAGQFTQNCGYSTGNEGCSGKSGSSSIMMNSACTCPNKKYYSLHSLNTCSGAGGGVSSVPGNYLGNIENNSYVPRNYPNAPVCSASNVDQTGAHSNSVIGDGSGGCSFKNSNRNCTNMKNITNVVHPNTKLSLNKNDSRSDLNSSLNSIKDFHPHLPPLHPAARRDFRKISEEKSGYLLWIITPVAASFSVAIVVAALAGPQWLFTEEKHPNANYNGTANFNAKDDGAFISKYTKSSLWILCSAMQGVETYNCMKIDYFPSEDYRPDPHDSTLAIPYTVTKSAPFFFVAGFALLISFIVFLIPTCSHQSNLYYFASGILFIVTGLLMFVGLIVYISIFKAEVGSKLRPKSTLQPPLFTFTYGQSFFLYVFGFFLTEFVGVLNIFLFISLQQVGHNKTISCLAFISNTNSPDRRKEIEAKNRKYHPYEAGDLASYYCKKDPVGPNNLPPPDLYRRYYFQKPTKCDIHPKNLARSLNELYTDSIPPFLPYDPLRSKHIPLTRSVSTATEIFSNHNSENSIHEQQHQFQGEGSHQKRNQQSSCSQENLSDICGFSRGILGKNRKSKDELFNEFCKKAGMRPKPKDIYYIEDNSNGLEEDDIFIVDSCSSLTKNRRNSFREPRKRNSASSFRSLDKIYPKSLFDLDRCDGNEIWNNNYSNSVYNSNQRFHEQDLYTSRTLPRSFMRRNFNPQEVYQPHSTNFDSNQTGRYANNYASNNILHRSCDNVSFIPCPQPKPQNTGLTVQWPQQVSTSSAQYLTKSPNYQHIPPPAADYTVYSTMRKPAQVYQCDTNPRQTNKAETFDLDQIERERRKSHASLFEYRGGEGYDMINGTAV